MTVPAPASGGTPPAPVLRRTFTLSGLASAQLPLRWLGLFAQRDLLPDLVELVRSGDMITARIVQDSLDDWRASILIEKIRMMPDTESAFVD